MEEAGATTLEVLEGLKSRPVTAEEVDKAKGKLLKEIELTLNDSSELCMALTVFIGRGDWRLFFLQRDRVQAVTAADVQKASAAYLKPSNRTLGRFLPDASPDRAEIPAPPDVSAMVKDYRGRTAVAQGEAFDASPANIDLRTERWNTEAGMKVAFLPKKTRGQSVTVHLTLRLGNEEDLFGKAAAGKVVAQLLMRGTRNLHKEQLQSTIMNSPADRKLSVVSAWHR